MSKRDLEKQDLYEAVKQLVELDSPHVHFNQHKLYTLFSIGFQYLLFRSTKEPGCYIIRIEDSLLADKLSKRSKDPSTRKFLQSMLLPRRIKYGQSWFYLDFFHLGSWALTNEIPKEKVKAALVVKDTSEKPMIEVDLEAEEDDFGFAMANLPKDYFITSLMNFVPRTITIAFDLPIEGIVPVEFPFIKRDREKTISGVTFSKDVDIDGMDS